jgi:opacity protein-like surface antigen
MLKRILLGSLAFGLVVAAAPASAQGGNYRQATDSGPELRVRVGNFAPDGESEYWDETFFDFTGSPDTFEDVVLGLDFILPLGPRLGLIFSGNGYSTTAGQAYRDFEDASGSDIRHDTTLEVASGTVGLVYRFAGDRAVVQPYVGAGGGFYNWSLEESGDFIDFDDLSIFSDTFFTDGTAFGTYALLGLNVPVSDNIAVFAEGRWDSADDELDGDFDGLGSIDLAGRQLAAGLSFRW